MTLAEDDARRFAGIPPGGKWPETLTLRKFVNLLAGTDKPSRNREAYRDWRDRVTHAVDHGHLPTCQPPASKAPAPVPPHPTPCNFGSTEWLAELGGPPDDLQPSPSPPPPEHVTRTNAALWLTRLLPRLDDVPEHARLWVADAWPPETMDGKRRAVVRRVVKLAVMHGDEGPLKVAADPAGGVVRMPGNATHHIKLYQALCPRLNWTDQRNGKGTFHDAKEGICGHRGGRLPASEQNAAPNYYRWLLELAEHDPELTGLLDAFLTHSRP